LISHRQLRLFACACCRQVSRLLLDERSRQAVNMAERFADGEASDEEREAAWQVGSRGLHGNSSFEAELACKTAGPGDGLTANRGLPRWFSVSTKQAATQASLLRDIAGNPFRAAGPLSPPLYQFRSDLESYRKVPIHPWLTPDVLALARAAYLERLPDR